MSVESPGCLPNGCFVRYCAVLRCGFAVYNRVESTGTNSMSSWLEIRRDREDESLQVNMHIGDILYLGCLEYALW